MIGSGKTQFFFHLMKYIFSKNYYCFYCKLGDLINKITNNGKVHVDSVKLPSTIKELIKETISFINNYDKSSDEVLNNIFLNRKDLREYFFDVLKVNSEMNFSENQIIIFIDEFEQSYMKLLKSIYSEDSSPLRSLMDSNEFLCIMAFGPHSSYNLLVGDADSRRLNIIDIPPLDLNEIFNHESLRKKKVELSSFKNEDLNLFWWISRARYAYFIRLIPFIGQDFNETLIEKINNIGVIGSQKIFYESIYYDLGHQPIIYPIKIGECNKIEKEKAHFYFQNKDYIKIKDFIKITHEKIFKYYLNNDVFKSLSENDKSTFFYKNKLNLRMFLKSIANSEDIILYPDEKEEFLSLFLHYFNFIFEFNAISTQFSQIILNIRDLIFFNRDDFKNRCIEYKDKRSEEAYIMIKYSVLSEWFPFFISTPDLIRNESYQYENLKERIIFKEKIQLIDNTNVYILVYNKASEFYEDFWENFSINIDGSTISIFSPKDRFIIVHIIDDIENNSGKIIQNYTALKKFLIENPDMKKLELLSLSIFEINFLKELYCLIKEKKESQQIISISFNINNINDIINQSSDNRNNKQKITFYLNSISSKIESKRILFEEHSKKYKNEHENKYFYDNFNFASYIKHESNTFLEKMTVFAVIFDLIKDDTYDPDHLKLIDWVFKLGTLLIKKKKWKGNRPLPYYNIFDNNFQQYQNTEQIYGYFKGIKQVFTKNSLKFEPFRDITDGKVRKKRSPSKDIKYESVYLKNTLGITQNFLNIKKYISDLVDLKKDIKDFNKIEKYKELLSTLDENSTLFFNGFAYYFFVLHNKKKELKFQNENFEKLNQFYSRKIVNEIFKPIEDIQTFFKNLKIQLAINLDISTLRKFFDEIFESLRDRYRTFDENTAKIEYLIIQMDLIFIILRLLLFYCYDDFKYYNFLTSYEKMKLLFQDISKKYNEAKFKFEKIIQKGIVFSTILNTTFSKSIEQLIEIQFEGDTFEINELIEEQKKEDEEDEEEDDHEANGEEENKEEGKSGDGIKEFIEQLNFLMKYIEISFNKLSEIENSINKLNDMIL